jgi:hypothetical protein
MRTIRKNLVECIELLRSEKVRDHLKAVHLLYLDLSSIADLDQTPTHILSYYQSYLICMHQSASKVGRWEKIKGLFKGMLLRKKIIKMIDSCIDKTFGEGDAYISQILFLIREAV